MTISTKSNTNAQKEVSSDGEMSLSEHLEELRWRLLKVLIGLTICMGVAFVFTEQFLLLLLEPLKTHVSAQPQSDFTGLFITYLKIAFVLGIFLSMPVILYQIWKFVAPGLYAHEKKWIIPFVFLGSLFFLLGGAFFIQVILPFMVQFFIEFGGDSLEFIKREPRIGPYISLCLKVLIGCGLVFQLPLVMWILAGANIIPYQTFKKFRQYWFLVAFILGAILSPPDVGTQLIMAGLLIVFYEIGIIGAWVLGKKEN